MFKHTFKYTDYNGVEREEDHYFDLTTPELMRLNFSSAGDFQETLHRITQEQNGKRIIELFESIIQMAYGEKSEDGRFFYKDEIRKQQFVCSPMYSQLYMKLATDNDFCMKFIKGITPPEAKEGMDKVNRPING